jgi:hypothetical protein
MTRWDPDTVTLVVYGATLLVISLIAAVWWF